MKKMIAMLICLTILAGLVESTADAQKRKKRAARKRTIKKVVKKKAAQKVKKPVLKEVLPPAPAPQAPWVAPPPPVYWAPPVMVPPTPIQPLAKPAGLGLTAGVKAGLTAGAFALTADVDYSLAKILDNAKARFSADFMAGNDQKGSNTFKNIDIKIGAIYDLVMIKPGYIPIDLYVGSAFILPIKVSDGRPGSKWGAEAFLGGAYKMAEVGTIYGELGYSGIKYDSGQPALKGISLGIGLSAAF